MMGNVCQAVNIVTGDKQAILVEPRLIDEQDMAGLENLLKEHVQLASGECSIYLQISEKALRKQAKHA